jgi:hypothetical protein
MGIGFIHPVNRRKSGDCRSERRAVTRRSLVPAARMVIVSRSKLVGEQALAVPS